MSEIKVRKTGKFNKKTYIIFLQLHIWGTSGCSIYFQVLAVFPGYVGEGLVISCHKKAAGCGGESKNSTTLPQRSVLYSI